MVQSHDASHAHYCMFIYSLNLIYMGPNSKTVTVFADIWPSAANFEPLLKTIKYVAVSLGYKVHVEH